MRRVMGMLAAAGLLLAGCVVDEPTAEERTAPANPGMRVRRECDHEMRELFVAAKAFYADHGEYPDSADELVDEGLLQKPPRWMVITSASDDFAIALTPEARDEPGCIRATAGTSVITGVGDN